MSGPPTGCDFIVRSPEGVVVQFDLSVYRLAAVKKAAYKFGDRCHVHIEMTGESQTRVTLRNKQKLDNVEYLAGEFANEVLDQELRELVAHETDAIRNLLLAQAFSKTSLIQPEFETADFRSDPCNIRLSDAPHPSGPNNDAVTAQSHGSAACGQ